MIDAAEAWLRGRGLRLLRVRYHKGDLARIEVPLDGLAALASPEVRDQLVPAFRALGFKFVTLDLEGFRSGSLNSLIPLDLLRSTSVRGLTSYKSVRIQALDENPEPPCPGPPADAAIP